VRFWIGLGSNLGDRLATLRSAATAVGMHGVILARSRVFASSPMGGPPQPPFLNAALLLETDLDPEQLLAKLHEIETELGRTRDQETVRWGPRTIDLDVLLMGQRGEGCLSLPDLKVPHSRMHERAFALAPLLDMEKDLLHPTLGRTLLSLLHATQQKGNACAPTGDLL
jgi:2-amino-4-hydroxy-6-hydroxymethyldihydropteridine diphosphokinase